MVRYAIRQIPKIIAYDIVDFFYIYLKIDMRDILESKTL